MLLNKISHLYPCEYTRTLKDIPYETAILFEHSGGDLLITLPLYPTQSLYCKPREGLEVVT